MDGAVYFLNPSPLDHQVRHVETEFHPVYRLKAVGGKSTYPAFIVAVPVRHSRYILADKNRFVMVLSFNLPDIELGVPAVDETQCKRCFVGKVFIFRRFLERAKKQNRQVASRLFDGFSL